MNKRLKAFLKAIIIELIILLVGIMFYFSIVPVNINDDQSSFLGLGMIITTLITIVLKIIRVNQDYEKMKSVQTMYKEIHEIDVNTREIKSINDRIRIYNESVGTFTERDGYAATSIAFVSKQMLNYILEETELIENTKDCDNEKFFPIASDYIRRNTRATSIGFVNFEGKMSLDYNHYFDVGNKKEIQLKLIDVRNNVRSNYLELSEPLGEHPVDESHNPLSYQFIPFIRDDYAYGCLVLGYPKHQTEHERSHKRLICDIFIKVYENYSRDHRVEELDRQNKYDVLVNAYNKKYGREIIDMAMNEAERTRKSMAFMIIDADHFKKVNDTYGHQTGDDTLITLANSIREVIDPRGGHLIRFGGEELIVVVEDIRQPDAMELAENIRINVRNKEIVSNGNRFNITISVGLSMYPSIRTRKYSELFELADRGVYEAKEQGRDRVVWK